jgi:tRNA pseudouridine38-40 synthase
MTSAGRRPTRTLALTVAYEGTDFAGWQRQPGARTVQEVLESALAIIEGQQVGVVAAGRTDAGVHALAQVVSVDVTNRLPAATLQRALNVRLPGDVRVTQVAEKPPGFNARRDARSKAYRYTLLLDPSPSPFVRRVVWAMPPRLDLTAMHQAAAMVVGEHDFAAFQAAGGDVRTSVRRVLRSRLRMVPGPPACVHYDIEGTGFLRHMVRNIVGTLVEIGRGRWPAEYMHELLASRDRRRAGATAPPEGLVLVRVRY